jgi:hypothetical protein
MSMAVADTPRQKLPFENPLQALKLLGVLFISRATSQDPNSNEVFEKVGVSDGV